MMTKGELEVIIQLRMDGGWYYEVEVDGIGCMLMVEG